MTASITKTNMRKGFKIKPSGITADGRVLFTDGTNTIIPDQISCEAYGYKFDNDTGTCYSFIPKYDLEEQLKEPSNVKKGDNNTIKSSTRNTFITGANNTTEGSNENSLIVGKNNTLNNGLNEATVLGGFGRALRYGEFVVGGGANGGRNTDNVPQFSVVQLSQNTTDNTATNLLVNGKANQYINTQANSIIGFEVFVTRLETGGSSGTAGLFSYRHIKGVIRVKNNLSTDITTYNSRIIGKDGVNGSASVVDVAAGTVSIQCSDRNNVNNSWSAVAYLHETLTNVEIT